MNKTMNEKKLMGDSSCSTLCEVYCTNLFGDIPVHPKIRKQSQWQSQLQ